MTDAAEDALAKRADELSAVIQSTLLALSWASLAEAAVERARMRELDEDAREQVDTMLAGVAAMRALGIIAAKRLGTLRPPPP